MRFSETLNQLAGKDRILFMRMLIQHIFQKTEQEIITNGKPSSPGRLLYQDYQCLKGVKFSFSIQKDYKSFGALPFLRWNKNGIDHFEHLLNKKDFMSQTLYNPMEGRAPDLRLIYGTVEGEERNRFAGLMGSPTVGPVFFFRYALFTDMEQGYPLSRATLAELERNKLLKLTQPSKKSAVLNAL